MLYHYLRVFNWICIFFGFRKPFPSKKVGFTATNIWHRIWSLFIFMSAIVSFVALMNVSLNFNIIKNLNIMYNANEVFVSVIIYLTNLVNDDKLCIEVYKIVNKILNKFQLSNQCLKMLSWKIYFWFSIMTAVPLVFTAFDIWLSDPPYVFLIRVPMFLAIFHLILHMSLILAILKVLNHKMFTLFNIENTTMMKQKSLNSKRIQFKYYMNIGIEFFDNGEPNNHLDLKCLCKIYDDISTCIQLLGKYHGKQILLTIWLMFSSAVLTAAVISRNEEKIPWLAISKSGMPFFWCFFGSYIDDQLRQEVERTELLIMKHLIDFRCDQSRRNTLQIFKQLVSTNRLQFSISNLFHLNYSMILGTILNVITYSIILIQLFLSQN